MGHVYTPGGRGDAGPGAPPSPDVAVCTLLVGTWFPEPARGGRAVRRRPCSLEAEGVGGAASQLGFHAQPCCSLVLGPWAQRSCLSFAFCVSVFLFPNGAKR